MLCSESIPEAACGLSKATVRILGNLARLPNGQRLHEVVIEAPIRVKDLLILLKEKKGVEVRRDSTLILVNGVEANALDDLDTEIEAGFEIVLVPMFHGGR
ncbi:MAG: MoaD/ThiS family protein [Nitrososphaerota archaeon]|nr:MoaD/ThiS family protein [Nitrososphaerota archaeon]